VRAVPVPSITAPPPDARLRLDGLSARLAAELPAKQPERNLLVGTWNLRMFGGMTEKWVSGESDSPKRNLFDVAAIARILSCFDVVAVQEVRGDIKALRHLLEALGPDWGFILTDVNRQPGGNDERFAFLFDSRRVKVSGLVCELVEPVEEDPQKIKPDAFNRQFARSPYAVSFVASGKTFVLVTLHVFFGKQASERVGELRAIAQWLAGWAKEVDNWGHNLICLGDFNIDRRGDPLYDAFTSTGLVPAKQLNDVRRTIFDKRGKSSFYDQIAWFADEKRGPMLSLRCQGAGSFDFVEELRGDLTPQALSFRISDHYPLWVDFSL
jgi:endonuclease/exonuclease/phosphatase family metal-dependent hydrolase